MRESRNEGTVPRWLKVGGAVLGGIAAAAAAAAAAGASVWNRDSARTVGRLAAAPRDVGAAVTFDPARVDGLPEPVRRYFAFALTPGQPLVRRARVEHAGDFASEPGQWAPFTSVQHFTAAPPGFVWDARIAMAPLVAVRVRDSYLGGEGALRGAVAGLVTVAVQRGTPEIAASALWRYLAEAVWLPTALLPSERLTWTGVDDSTARATLTDRGVTATADFHFGPSGEIVRVTGERYRAAGDRQVLTATDGRHSRYARVDGMMMVPMSGEVAWLLPEGPHAYWRGRVVRTRYEYAGPGGGAANRYPREGRAPRAER